MRSIVLLTLLLATVSIGQVPVQQDEDSPVAVLEFKWYRDRKAVPKTDARNVTPARAVIAENKKFQREARAQLSPGAIDPNTLTVDGRSEALEKSPRNHARPRQRRSKDLHIMQNYETRQMPRSM